MNSSYLLLIFGAIACFVQSVQTINCYYCNSLDNRNCGIDDNFNSNKIKKVDCTHVQPPAYLPILKYIPATGCAKITRIDINNNQVEYVRKCFWGDLQQTAIGCTQDPFYKGIYAKCDVCDTDLCNGETNNSPKKFQFNTISILLSLIIVKLFLV